MHDPLLRGWPPRHASANVRFAMDPPGRCGNDSLDDSMMHQMRRPGEAELPVDKSGRVVLVGSVLAAASGGPKPSRTYRRLAQPATVPQPRPRDHQQAHRPGAPLHRPLQRVPWAWTPAMLKSSSPICAASKAGHRPCAATIERPTVVLARTSLIRTTVDRVCEQRFGTHPAQVLFECGNTAAHVQDNEQNPLKRPFHQKGAAGLRSCRRASVPDCQCLQEGLAAGLPRLQMFKVVYSLRAALQ